MKTFRKRTALRIALVSLLVASLATPIAWWLTVRAAESSIAAMADEESHRLLHRFDAIDLTGPDAVQHAQAAAQAIAGGLFDIVEIYDAHGEKLAESLTVQGQAVEPQLPKHGKPAYTRTWYESLKPQANLWLLRVFVPLSNSTIDTKVPITGYFEGVRVIQVWQQEQILNNSLFMALTAGLASLACGAMLYPVVVNLSADNARQVREVLAAQIAMMEVMGRAIARRDLDTGAHNYRVAWIAASIGERMGLKGGAMQALIVGSFLHDVGKIGIPDAILLKPGSLDEVETITMRTHVALGEEILSGIAWLEGARSVVAAHHEKWNGLGYPRSLQGEAIALAARIFAVADVFDALCSRRPYKDGMGFDEAMAIMEKDTGSHFDPAVMDVFRSIAHRLFDRLLQASEDDARLLMEERVRLHFEI